jgi:hypothetical protein
MAGGAAIGHEQFLAVGRIAIAGEGGRRGQQGGQREQAHASDRGH